MNARQLLSVTMITLNEEKRIRDALESVRWADEIVVVDSGSTDATVAICREYTDEVHQIPWHGFVEQKNIATAHAAHEWILNLDADECVSSELAEEIRQALAGTSPIVGYYMPRKTYYLGDWIQHCGWYPDYKLRLFQKQTGKWVGEVVHEKVEVRGPVAYFRHPLYHYSYEDISDHLHRMDAYSTLAAARKRGPIGGVQIFGHTVLAFLKKYIVKQGFRDGTRGMIVCLLSAFTVMLKYAKAWEHHLHDEP